MPSDHPSSLDRLEPITDGPTLKPTPEIIFKRGPTVRSSRRPRDVVLEGSTTCIGLPVDSVIDSESSRQDTTHDVWEPSLAFSHPIRGCKGNLPYSLLKSSDLRFNSV